MTNLLIALMLLPTDPLAAVTFHGDVAHLRVSCNCPRCEPCPCPTLKVGGVLPWTLLVRTKLVETWQCIPPVRYGLEEWLPLEAMLGSRVERNYTLLQTEASFNGRDLMDLCVSGPFDDFDPEPVRHCSFSHLAAVLVVVQRGRTWWMDLYRDGRIDMRDVQVFQNRFGQTVGGGGDGEG